MVDMNKGPYFDRFKPENNWSKLGFMPDRALQASELNELQSIFSHYIERISSVILTEGNVTDGFSWEVNEEGNIEVGPGEVYLEGKVRDYQGETLILNPEEPIPDKLYVRLEKRIITEEENEDLLDKNSALPNYFSPGAHRLEEKVRVSAKPKEGVEAIEVQRSLNTLMPDTVTSAEEPSYLKKGDQWHRVSQ